jgi:hypothetical protein
MSKSAAKGKAKKSTAEELAALKREDFVPVDPAAMGTTLRKALVKPKPTPGKR